MGTDPVGGGGGGVDENDMNPGFNNAKIHQSIPITPFRVRFMRQHGGSPDRVEVAPKMGSGSPVVILDAAAGAFRAGPAPGA